MYILIHTHIPGERMWSMGTWHITNRSVKLDLNFKKTIWNLWKFKHLHILLINNSTLHICILTKEWINFYVIKSNITRSNKTWMNYNHTQHQWILFLLIKKIFGLTGMVWWDLYLIRNRTCVPWWKCQVLITGLPGKSHIKES